LIVLRATISFSFSSFHSDLGKQARETAEHFCPWYSKAPLIRAVTTASQSALG